MEHRFYLLHEYLNVATKIVALYEHYWLRCGGFHRDISPKTIGVFAHSMTTGECVHW